MAARWRAQVQDEEGVTRYGGDGGKESVRVLAEIRSQREGVVGDVRETHKMVSEMVFGVTRYERGMWVSEAVERKDKMSEWIICDYDDFVKNSL